MIEARVYHSTKKCGAEWKPLLVGSDVDRYRINWPGRRYIRYGEWLMYPSDQTVMENPKIVLRQTSSTIRACLDEDAYYCQNSTFIIASDRIELRALLGMLNSAVVAFAYRMGNPQTGKVFAEIKPSVVKQLPIVDLAGAETMTETWKEISELVSRMLGLQKRLCESRAEHETSVMSREIVATDRRVDRLVYKLYGLTDKEIRIVEEATK